MLKKGLHLQYLLALPNLAEGIFEIIISLNFSSILSVIAVLIKPGEIQLILIFFFAYSIAKTFRHCNNSSFRSSIIGLP